jgi:hypothetical protein
MLLKKQIISSRAFLLQFMQIMQEFGGIIPWLKELENVCFYTNVKYFTRELSRTLGFSKEMIIPYQFLTSGSEREFFGGLLHFTKSPEKFKDKKLAKIKFELELKGASYLTCLHVRDIKRGQKTGTEIMRRIVFRILEAHPCIWGVCERDLVEWYVSLGASILNNGDNYDGLAVISWVQ